MKIKFIKWEGDNVLFSKTTWWERVKSNLRIGNDILLENDDFLKMREEEKNDNS